MMLKILKHLEDAERELASILTLKRDDEIFLVWLDVRRRIAKIKKDLRIVDADVSPTPRFDPCTVKELSAWGAFNGH